MFLTLAISNSAEKNGTIGFSDVLAVFGCVLGAASLPLVLGLLIRRNEKCRKEILLWLNDAVELPAFVRQKGVLQSGLTSNNIYKIQVEFEYDGQNNVYESRGKPLGGFKSSDGYHNVWKDYVNRRVTILFSPRYKEVIVLKPNKTIVEK